MAIEVRIRHKNSTTKIPTATQLVYGELAINYGKGTEGIYIKNDSDEIVKLGGTGGGSVDYAATAGSAASADKLAQSGVGENLVLDNNGKVALTTAVYTNGIYVTKASAQTYSGDSIAVKELSATTLSATTIVGSVDNAVNAASATYAVTAKKLETTSVGTGLNIDPQGVISLATKINAKEISGETLSAKTINATTVNAALQGNVNGNVTGNLTGTATYADMAANADSATNATTANTALYAKSTAGTASVALERGQLIFSVEGSQDLSIDYATLKKILGIDPNNL